MSWSDDRRHQHHRSSRDHRTDDNRRSPPHRSSTRDRQMLRHRDTKVHEESDQSMAGHVFNYERHKYDLNKMFFMDYSATDEPPLRVGTKEYEDLWAFIKKFQLSAVKAADEGREDHHRLSIERKIADLDHKIPDQWRDVSELMAKVSVVNDLDDRYYRTNGLSAARVGQFRNACILYLDFLDKQRAKALAALKQMQMDLPIYEFREQILDAVQKHSVVLIAGDTGCGKSTQVPQYLMSAGFENICCSQPRRIACISLRKRVAYETQNEFGTQIGYQIRFERSKSKHTKILFLTEGLLLRQVSTDPMLSNYNVIILDEVHERHLSCDFLLGVMKCLIHRRSHDLKVILMSATIKTEMFSEYFGGCPVLQVPGRLYPIEVKYFPIPKIKFSAHERTGNRTDAGPYLRILQMIDDKYDSKERGDLLVFLSGLTEINSVGDELREYAKQTQKWIILYLHSTLSIAEQDKVFDVSPDGVRKCILSTNIAETSLTIDGIRFVCDSGKVKEMSYDSTTRMQRLQEFWISVASAEQRKGRAGRTGPGVSYRLYSENDFQSFEHNSKPEIRRVPLHSLLLQMISMGLPDARKFPFLEPPALKSIEESLTSLKEQSALTGDEQLTPMGKMLARLPVDITIGKMLILSSVFDLTDPILSLAAALSVQSPITNQSMHDRDAIEARRSVQSTEGDPFTLLNAYNKWLEIKSQQIDSKKWCRQRGFEEQRFYEMTKLRQQFKDILKEAGLLSDGGHTDMSMYEFSADRIRRHGEVKQLRQLKRDYDRKAPKRRKMLRMDGEDADDGSGDDKQIDVKDVEFRLSHDRRQVQALRDASTGYTHRDITLMKLILCNGLHPQLAIGDEHNSYKTDSDQLFHTKDKPFVTLHPNGAFACEPDLLRLSHGDDQLKGFGADRRLSRCHQLIAYVSLLETTKPYLCNCVRIPAAHVLLLVSNAIDTNYDFTRIVSDGWLELEFADSQSAQQFVWQAIEVRDLWLQLLHKLFYVCFETNSDGETDRSTAFVDDSEVRRMRNRLVKSIYSFIRKEIHFSMKRLMAADIKELYMGRHDLSQDLSLIKDFKRNDKVFSECADRSHNEYSADPIKGGLQIRPYLTYNCLSNASQSTQKLVRKDWKCESCGQQMSLTPLERIRHTEQCKSNGTDGGSHADGTTGDGDDDGADGTASTIQAFDPLRIVYTCGECQQKLMLTATQILRHKRTHQLKSTDTNVKIESNVT